MKFIVFIVIAFYGAPFEKALAQEISYFDDLEKPTSDKSAAAYYRTIDKAGKQFIVKDFYKNGKIRRLAFCIATEPTLIFDGSVFWFSPKGFLIKEGTYVSGLAHGRFKEFTRTGQPKAEYLYRGDQKRYSQYWSTSGEQLVFKGLAAINDFDAAKNETNHVIIEDSVMLESFIIRHAKSDTIYTMLDEHPEYKGGLPLFYSEVAGQLVYPVSARRHGLEGKVIVKFIVGKNGEIEEASVVEGLREDCDVEAKRAIEHLNVKWIPGKFHHKFVKSSLTLPVFFKLT